MPRDAAGSESSRREFIAAAAALAIGRPAIAMQTKPDSAAPLFKISLAQWSLHRAFQSGTLDPLHFAELAKASYGVDAIEYVNSFYKDKIGDASYIAQLRRRADDSGVRSLLIMCDGEGALGDPDAKQRTQTVHNHIKWVEAAQALGCHSIRVNAQSSGSPDEQRKLVVDGLLELVNRAGELNVIVENHGGISSNGGWLASVIKAVNHPRCGTLPDFGNFHLGKGKDGGDEWYDRYIGVRELMPFAKAVSAKSNDFDKKGNETKTDFRKMIKIVLDAGYHGHIGIEYEGGRLSEAQGIKATKALLERVRDELAAA